MVDWAKLNRNLSYINDGLQFGLDLIRPKKDGETTGEKISTAGINLFGNAQATYEASVQRNIFGSNLGYLAKNSANGDGLQAYQNTLETGLWSAQTRMMYGGYYDPYCSYGGMWDSQMPMTSYSTPMWPGSGTFSRGFFRTGWFG